MVLALTNKEVSIDEVIMHQLSKRDPSSGYRPSLKSVPSLSPDLSAFFAGHIRRSYENTGRRGARFVAKGNHDVPAKLQQLIARKRFVANSIEVGEAMFEAMDARVKPATLAVVHFRVGRDRAIALLKLDPGEYFRPVLQNEGSPHEYWDLELIVDVLPSTGEDLHKAAFIGEIGSATIRALPDERPEEPEPGPVEFLILDRDVREGEVALYRRWWLERFLQAAPTMTEEDKARRTRTSLIDARNHVATMVQALPRAAAADAADSLQAADDLIDRLPWMESIDLDAEIERLGLPEELNAEFTEMVQRAVPDRVVTIPRSLQEDFPKARWTGHHGLSVRIDGRHSRDVSAVQDGDKWVVTIETEDWKRVT